MEVCTVCGSLLIVGDIQSRLDEHINGKQHAGYAKIRASLERVIVSKRTLEYDRLITRAHGWRRQKWLMLKAMFCIVATESPTTWKRTKPSCGKTSAFVVHSRQTSTKSSFSTDLRLFRAFQLLGSSRFKRRSIQAASFFIESPIVQPSSIDLPICFALRDSSTA